MRRLRKLLQTLLSAYMVIASLVLAGLAGTIILLWAKGILDTVTLQRIGKVVRREPVGDEVRVPTPPEKFTHDIQVMGERVKAENELKRRALEAEEHDFNLIVKKGIEDREAKVAAAKAAEDAREKEFEAGIAEREAAVQVQETAKKSGTLKLDIDLLSRIDAEQAAKMVLDMKTRDPERTLLLLRSLRPRIVAEIFSAMLADKKDPAAPAAALDLQDQLTRGAGPSPTDAKIPPAK